MKLIDETKKTTKQLNHLFETVKIPVTQKIPKKSVPPGKRAYQSKNLKILPPDLDPTFSALESTLKKVRLKQRPHLQLPSFVKSAGLFIALAALFLACFYLIVTLSFKNVSLKQETAELLKEYQAVDKKQYELKEEIGKYYRRAGELENFNQFLLQKIAEQEKELKALSFTVTEQVLDLRRQMKSEQEFLLDKQGEILRDRYNDLLKQQKKSFHELFFNSYDAKKGEKKSKEGNSEPIVIDDLWE